MIITENFLNSFVENVKDVNLFCHQYRPKCTRYAKQILYWEVHQNRTMEKTTYYQGHP